MTDHQASFTELITFGDEREIFFFCSNQKSRNSSRKEMSLRFMEKTNLFTDHQNVLRTISGVKTNIGKGR